MGSSTISEIPSDSPPRKPKPYFYYGHRAPSQNRPVVRGGFFSNRKTLPSAAAASLLSDRRLLRPSIDFRDWDSSSPTSPSSPSSSSLPSLPSSDRRLSPLARFVLSSLRRHRRWGPAVISDLSKLRRVPSSLVSEVLRSRPALPPSLSLPFFLWSGKQKRFRHSFTSFHALAFSLSLSRLPAAVDQLPDLMRAHGKTVSEKQLDVLVRLHSESNRPLRLFQVYRRMRSEFNIRPRVFLYNRILDSLIRGGHIDLALSVYDDLRADGVKEEPITFTILAKGLCRAGRIEPLLELLGRMRTEVCRPDVFAYTAMVKVMALKGDMDGCLKVWEEMRRDGVVADVMAYGTMVSGLCKVGRVEKGRELFREMKEKKFLIDRSVYGALVEGFVAEGKVGEGCELLKEMVDDGYRADLGIYNALIGGLCSIGRAEKACKLFQIVVQEELIPSLQTVTPLLASYADVSEMNKFFHLIDRLVGLNLPVIDHLSDFFTFFLEKEGRQSKALRVFEALKGKGYCNVGIYNILIESFHKIKEVKKALSLFDEMKGSKDFQPDSSTYSHIIRCFVDKGDVREACSCYNSMMKMSWAPSVSAYCSLVKGLSKIGEVDAAITLVKDCLGNVTNGPMEFKYTLTILNVCRSKRPEKVIDVLEEMIELGYPLEDIIYCAVIHGFCKYASSEEARKVFAVMRDRSLLTEANFIVYEEILNEHLKKVTAGLVISGLKFFGLESKLKWTTNLD
ncbi:pentatricopeptide repeat-containing protein At4g20740 [Typha angustifolia]|uniref:pentatricopeptide repeat-containing protein At4g20740 n=1 Tax=Typha angustifolia TaxID=59011 RepID=UPI003C2D5825